MKKSIPVPHEPTEAEIQHQAYLLWLEGGCRDGGALEDWQAAKELIRHRHGHAASRRKPPAAANVPLNVR
jgi:hypothetical protein